MKVHIFGMFDVYELSNLRCVNKDFKLYAEEQSKGKVMILKQDTRSYGHLDWFDGYVKNRKWKEWMCEGNILVGQAGGTIEDIHESIVPMENVEYIVRELSNCVTGKWKSFNRGNIVIKAWAQNSSDSIYGWVLQLEEFENPSFGYKTGKVGIFNYNHKSIEFDQNNEYSQRLSSLDGSSDRIHYDISPTFRMRIRHNSYGKIDGIMIHARSQEFKNYIDIYK
jgi:hypothetical protein